ncbi:cupin-like domain-containing protein [Marinobacter nauticus]|uniref:cupin-like domain-containing protein n=1 Tax=Marinobacter nauticus TaxID=2743 RepID=UPI001CFEBB8E|nr:cupin-like domain-containing protein [Marinobacter nauticus]
MSDMNETKSILKVLDYTKANKQWFDSRELPAGYHSVELNGQHFRGQRDPASRLKKLSLDFAGKTVLDLGCSNGGVLHNLAPEVAFGVGVDYNAKCINAANVLKAAADYRNVNFYVFDLDREDITLLPSFMLGREIDICLFLNLSLWIKSWKAVFQFCAERCGVMVFEAHGSEEQQQEQLAFVESIYVSVVLASDESDDDPTYAKRRMYLCEHLRSDQETQHSNQETKKKAPTLFQSHSEDAVTAAYEAAFPGETAESVQFQPNTHESIVAEVNGCHIVKFPRPSRGLDGIAAEKAATDLVRDQVGLAIPEILIKQEPVALARYPKIPGAMFNRKRYAELDHAKREALAEQLAQFLMSLHAVPLESLPDGLRLAPSWSISVENIEAFLGNDNDHVIRSLLPEIVRNQRALNVPETNQVFGHFDLHGSNVLVDDDYRTITGVIDFGNCKIGDVHQDLSVMNLSSPDLANRIISLYERCSGRSINRLLVEHYTTIFYLNLLAGLRRRQDIKQFDYWLGQLHKWYDHLLARKVKNRLESRQPLSRMHLKWREWLASQVISGVDQGMIKGVLRQQGYSDLDIAAELIAAQDHPFIKAGKKSQHLLEKRNWLLQTADALGRLDPHYAEEIEVREAPDFQTFLKEYYSRMRPVVLKGGVDHWPALGRWTPEYLRKKVGHAEVEIQYGRDGDPDYERNARQHKKRILMRDFVDMVVGGGETNDYYMTAGNTRKSLEGIESLFQEVGDFHKGYRTPETFHRQNLLWFGPKGTFTPLHHDLTNNMLVQLYGRKKVTVYPPFQIPYLYNDKGVFSEIDVRDPKHERHPLFKNAKGMEVILEPGDAIFLPIACWHVVESLDISISITFTDFGCNNGLHRSFPR